MSDNKVTAGKQVPRSKEDLTKELMEREFVDDQQKKHDLQTAIFQISKTHPFLGSVMQCMNIMYTHTIPTAGVSFNNDLKRWDVHINPRYFCKHLNPDHRRAVMLHEVYHIIHKHPFRIPMMHLPPQKRRLMNIAMDMAINQYIKGIPRGCNECPPLLFGHLPQPCSSDLCPGHGVNVDDYFDTDKSGNKAKWQTLQSAEYYYEKLLTRLKDGDEEAKGGVNIKGLPGSNSDDGAQGKGDVPDTMDVHDWGDSADEKDVLDATDDLMKRAMIKQNLSYDDLPGSIRELMDHIDSRRAELNYKAIILMAMKASLPSNTRKHSWSRKSRRFGNKAPGTKNASQPKLEIFIDTSGSISVQEANEFLDIVDEFLKVGARTCHLNMFHTANYYSERYKMGQRPEKKDFEMGGTCLQESMAIIAKKKPDLSIFLTDGYYSDINVEAMVGVNAKFPKTVFIISKDGSEKHPFAKRDWARTVKIPGEKRYN